MARQLIPWIMFMLETVAILEMRTEMFTGVAQAALTVHDVGIPDLVVCDVDVWRFFPSSSEDNYTMAASTKTLTDRLKGFEISGRHSFSGSSVAFKEEPYKGKFCSAASATVEYVSGENQDLKTTESMCEEAFPSFPTRITVKAIPQSAPEPLSRQTGSAAATVIKATGAAVASAVVAFVVGLWLEKK